jgi:hypothetical protein
MTSQRDQAASTALLPEISLASYNVLSSHLANPESYPTYKPEHLDANARLKKVLAKLEVSQRVRRGANHNRLPRNLISTRPRGIDSQKVNEVFCPS